ncbi:GNAT family protein [Salinicola sp. MIT1003]|jgi:RimJ/RimL family protein N-acetyltransferase|uniref:GNAT family N-acetyltransferase n=1 Tax=Salinicola sp. MIT1003 TaxID=1882734 RepID=UPI0008DD828E|nr:GNAT family protein [Salinicola sp. MIT1003]OHZ04890.1 acetyltransferase [Salinicola sp. MIT1003]
MNHIRNEYGQPVGPDIDGWQPPPTPRAEILEGRFCRLEPLDVSAHAPTLWRAWQPSDPDIADDHDGKARWTYLGGRGFDGEAGCRRWLETMTASDDPHCYAIIDPADDQAVGMATYLRIVPVDGSIEIGHLNFSPRMARTPISSEALMLLIRHVFELGYRRVEWKCDALNAPSLRAAARLGFRFEGIFRQHRVVNGRNRDTAWFSILDGEWPAIRECHRRWLAPDNFDADGRQRQSLSTMTAELTKPGH